MTTKKPPFLQASTTEDYYVFDSDPVPLTTTTARPKPQPHTHTQKRKTTLRPVNAFLNDNDVCGKSVTATTALIIGGSLFKKGDFPWMAAFFYNDEFICGGSLGIDEVYS